MPVPTAQRWKGDLKAPIFFFNCPQATESATKDFVLAVLSEAALCCQSDLKN